MSKLNKDIVIYDTFENTYRRGKIVEDNSTFITIETGITPGGWKRTYQYPVKDIISGEFIVFVKE